MNPQRLPTPIVLGGRYQLTHVLAVGGMSEIYLANMGSKGVAKQVVVKRIKPELSRDVHLIEMFRHEAKVGSMLNHPNIVHVYDVDDDEMGPYIVMEYIEGYELNVFLRRGISLGKPLPLDYAVELVRQTAMGMAHFHAKKTVVGGTLGYCPL